MYITVGLIISPFLHLQHGLPTIWHTAETRLPLDNRPSASARMDILHLPTSFCHALFAWFDSQSYLNTISPRHEIKVFGLPKPLPA